MRDITTLFRPSNTFDLDLSFNCPSQDMISKKLSASNKAILTESRFWENDLKNWIDFVRSDNSLTCHKVVRLTSFVSMGLQFTDDLTITSLNTAWRQKTEKTDVLSFPVLGEAQPLPTSDSEFVEIGDIIVSIETAYKQANLNQNRDHVMLHR